MFDAQTIVHIAEQSFGHPFHEMAFHAYDDNQMPVGAPLPALEYVHWLKNTYSSQPIATLRTISKQYDVAIQSAKNSPGILPEALGNLVLSAAVFHALAESSTEQEPMSAAVSTQYTQPAIEKSIPPTIKNNPASASSTDDEQEKNTLLHLRSELMESLHISSPRINHADLVAHINDMVDERKKVLNIEHAEHRMSKEGVEQEIQKLHRSLMQKALQLQSINARVGETETVATEEKQVQTNSKAAPLPKTESLDALRAEEQKLIAEIQELDTAVQNSSLREERLRRVQTHIQIVEQLLQIIREETVE